MIGHLLECAGQVCGGYYADPGKKDVPDLWNLGFPLAEVNEQGDGFISKLEGTGGIVNPSTCTEQMIYELHDPSAYFTPDCIADFSNVEFTLSGKDTVAFSGATGRAPTDTLKTSVGYNNGYAGEGQISYGGINCYQRARLASEIVRKRLELQNIDTKDARFDLIGVDSLSPGETNETEGREVRLRVAKKTRSRDEANMVANEVESLYTNGPAGGGGATKQVNEIVSVLSVLVSKSDIKTKVDYTII